MSSGEPTFGAEKPEDHLSELAPPLLIAHAVFLASQAGDPELGRVHSRRAVSAAYYAVFHGVTTYVAWSVAPTASIDERYELSRLFTHTGVEKVAKWLQGKGSPPGRSKPLAAAITSAHLGTFADRFVQLKEWREMADYNHRSAIGRYTAGSACAVAQVALDAIEAAWDEPDWRSFCTFMIVEATTVKVR